MYIVYIGLIVYILQPNFRVIKHRGKYLPLEKGKKYKSFYKTRVTPLN